MDKSDLRQVKFESFADLVEELQKLISWRIVGVRGPKDKVPRYVDAPRMLQDATEIVARYRDTGKQFVIRRKHFGPNWTVWLPDGNELILVVASPAADPTIQVVVDRSCHAGAGSYVHLADLPHRPACKAAPSAEAKPIKKPTRMTVATQSSQVSPAR